MPVPSIEQLLRDTEPVMRKLAKENLSRYSRWMGSQELDDLLQVGRLALTQWYKNGDIDFQKYTIEQCHKFIKQKTNGVMENHLLKQQKNLSRETPVQDIEIIYDRAQHIEFDMLLFRNRIIESIIEFMNRLNGFEKTILVLRYGENKIVADICERTGRSRHYFYDSLRHILEKLIVFFKEKQGWSVKIDDITAYLEEADLRPLKIYLEEEM